jgi:hypothetical protein
MSFLSLEGSVGLCGRNNPIDVAVIQLLLKSFFKPSGNPGRPAGKISPFFQVDGECTQLSIDLIKQIQTGVLGMRYPDGRIDPMGKTFQLLKTCMKNTPSSVKEVLFGPAPVHTGVLAKVNPDRLKKFFKKRG